MISVKLTKSKKNKDNIIRYQCPKNHLLSKINLSFYICRSGLTYDLLKNTHTQFGHYYRCPECNTSYYEDEWELVDLDFNNFNENHSWR
ncbi:MAG: hypothetical protein ACFFCE_15670 [Promethearchaeota archaeon]